MHVNEQIALMFTIMDDRAHSSIKADFIPLDEDDDNPGKEPRMPNHDNIRGEDYYQ